MASNGVTTKKLPSRTNVFRVRLRLHYSWIIAFLFIIVIVYTQYPEAYATWRRFLLGAATALIFLILIILHQTLINLLAISRKIPLRQVTIHIFGGIPGITREFTTPLIEMLLGTAGLLFSLIIVILLFLVYSALVVAGSTIFGNLVSWLIFVMAMFTVAHIIPGFPLDGGRILRAFLWRQTKDYDRATQITAWIGQGLGLLSIAGGVTLMLLNKQWFTGVAFIFIGAVLFGAATQIQRMTTLRHTLRKTTIKDVASACPQIDPELSLGEFATNYILARGHSYVVVVDKGKLIGSIALSDIKSVPKKFWWHKKISEFMRPTGEIDTALADQSAADVLERMSEMEIDEIPVMEGDRPLGIISRESLLNLAKIRRDLHL